MLQKTLKAWNKSLLEKRQNLTSFESFPHGIAAACKFWICKFDSFEFCISRIQSRLIEKRGALNQFVNSELISQLFIVNTELSNTGGRRNNQRILYCISLILSNVFLWFHKLRIVFATLTNISFTYFHSSHWIFQIRCGCLRRDQLVWFIFCYADTKSWVFKNHHHHHSNVHHHHHHHFLPSLHSNFCHGRTKSWILNFATVSLLAELSHFKKTCPISNNQSFSEENLQKCWNRNVWLNSKMWK